MEFARSKLGITLGEAQVEVLCFHGAGGLRGRGEGRELPHCTHPSQDPVAKVKSVSGLGWLPPAQLPALQESRAHFGSPGWVSVQL